MNEIKLPIGELKPALAGLGRVIKRRSAYSALGCVKIARDADRLVSLSGSDKDSFAVVELRERQQGGPVEMLAPFETLLDAAKHLGKGDQIVVVDVGGRETVLKTTTAGNVIERKLEFFSPKEFPLCPVFEDEEIPITEALKAAIREARECTSEDQMRSVLTGVCLDVSTKEGHHVVGTDGKHVYAANTFKLSIKDSIIIPDRKFLKWNAFLKDGDMTFNVLNRKDNTPTLIRFRSAHWTFITRLVDGRFPNWREVVPPPSAANTWIEWTRETASLLLDLIPKLPCEQPRNKPLGLLAEHGVLKIRSRSNWEEKWSSMDLKGVAVKGKDIKLSINRDYVLKALRFGFLKAELTNAEGPVRFVGDGKLMVAMPLRTPDVSESKPSESPPCSSPTTPSPEPVESSKDTPSTENESSETEDGKFDSNPQERKPMIANEEKKTEESNPLAPISMGEVGTETNPAIPPPETVGALPEAEVEPDRSSPRHLPSNPVPGKPVERRRPVGRPMELNIADLIRSPDILARRINPEVARKYQELMEQGVKFPPPTVFKEGEKQWLADGLHRIEGRSLAGHATIVCKVFEGTERDARLHAAGANALHGFPLTNEEKRLLVGMMLQDDEWWNWTDRRIAKHCGVGRTLVGELKKEIATVRDGQSKGGESVPADGEVTVPATRTYINRHGQEGVMRTGRIGKRKRKSDEPETEAEPSPNGEDPGAHPQPDSPAPVQTPPVVLGKFAEDLRRWVKAGSEGSFAATIKPDDLPYYADAVPMIRALMNDLEHKLMEVEDLQAAPVPVQ